MSLLSSLTPASLTGAAERPRRPEAKAEPPAPSREVFYERASNDALSRLRAKRRSLEEQVRDLSSGSSALSAKEREVRGNSEGEFPPSRGRPPPSYDVSSGEAVRQSEGELPPSRGRPPASHGISSGEAVRQSEGDLLPSRGRPPASYDISSGEAVRQSESEIPPSRGRPPLSRDVSSGEAVRQSEGELLPSRGRPPLSRDVSSGEAVRQSEGELLPNPERRLASEENFIMNRLPHFYGTQSSTEGEGSDLQANMSLTECLSVQKIQDQGIAVTTGNFDGALPHYSISPFSANLTEYYADLSDYHMTKLPTKSVVDSGHRGLSSAQSEKERSREGVSISKRLESLEKKFPFLGELDLSGSLPLRDHTLNSNSCDRSSRNLSRKECGMVDLSRLSLQVHSIVHPLKYGSFL